MNELDDVKALRLEEERRKFVNSEWVRQLTHLVLDPLVAWANESFFDALGGELTYEITYGPANAVIHHSFDRPNHPRLELRELLINQFYQEAFAFPIISRRLAKETIVVKGVDENPVFAVVAGRFTTPVPPVPYALVAHDLRPAARAVAESNAKDDKGLSSDDINCRFAMYELMLAWTFFHELGHVLQRHAVIKGDFGEPRGLIEEIADEVDTTLQAERAAGFVYDTGSLHARVHAQAREVLADAEAVGLVLDYLARTRRLQTTTVYLLFCAMGMVFQRFYDRHDDHLQLAPHGHPHPVIRDEIARMLLMKQLQPMLLESAQSSTPEAIWHLLVYLHTRAEVMVGMIRSHRIERRSDEHLLPSYARLTGPDHTDERSVYIAALAESISAQADAVAHKHIAPRGAVDRLLQYLQAHVPEPGYRAPAAPAA